MSKVVPFHEGAREFRWHIASKRVYDTTGLLVAENCYNLKQAREAVRKKYRL